MPTETLKTDGAAAASNAHAKDTGMTDDDNLLSMLAGEPTNAPAEPPVTTDDAPAPTPEDVSTSTKPTTTTTNSQKPSDSTTTEEPTESESEEEVTEDDDEIVNLSFDPLTGELKAPTPRRAKDIRATGDVDMNKLTPEEQRRMWQSQATVANAQVESLTATIAALEKRLSAFESGTNGQQPDTPAPQQPTSFNRQPADFMPQGVSYDPYESGDASTPSGRAFQTYLAERDKFMLGSVENSVLAKVRAEQEQRMSSERLTTQINTLRTHPTFMKEYGSDDSVRSLIEWASEPRSENLVYLAMAKSLSEGRLPLKASAFKTLRQAFTPNGNGAASVASIPSASDSEPKVDDDIKALSDLFADGANVTL